VTLRARWVTLRAHWVTLRARWVTLRALWVTLRARWVTLRALWVTQVKVFQAAIMAGKQWKDSPPDDYFSEVMALLGEVRLHSLPPYPPPPASERAASGVSRSGLQRDEKVPNRLDVLTGRFATDPQTRL
jgi:hypothetical protein